MDFMDLNGQIEADDWLIPRSEVTHKRLIRQTPSYNIYKADWFGDVLLYEPRENSPQEVERCRPKTAAAHGLEHFGAQAPSLSRLAELNLSLSRLETPRLVEDLSDTDSAYSSLSSTPEFHTKVNGSTEFQFPVTSSSSPTTRNVQIERPKPTTPKQNKNSTLLNRKSYCFNHRQLRGTENSHKKREQADSWLELNELRLIAHEGFMLFMGASLEDAYNNESNRKTSLVIQMNHPNTVSLYNLLHRNDRSSSFRPDTERFLSSHSHKYSRLPHNQLTVEAKLNICQQVTNAMTYLHDKNIVHGKLTSVNICIELNQRVKISLIDHDENALVRSNNSTLDPESCAESRVQFNLPALTYLSPELLKTFKLNCANNENTHCDYKGQYNCHNQQIHLEMDLQKLTRRSDVFSFGTLLFELFEERFPFSSQANPSYLVSSNKTSLPLESPLLRRQNVWNENIDSSAAELIYQIGAGLITQMNIDCCNLKPNLEPVAHIIAACWATNPEDRPLFKQLSFA